MNGQGVVVDLIEDQVSETFPAKPANGESDCFVKDYLSESLAVTAAFAADEASAAKMVAIAKTITDALRNGKKLMVAGNGGSAADAQHIAAEFVSRLMFDRAPLPAIALTTDSSALTAIGNDYGYDFVFERQIRALGQVGDVFVGISTSGRSPNILRALEAARSRGVITIGFTGSQGGPFADLCNLVLAAPSTKTVMIQQVHITAAHIVCALVERAMFPIAAETARA